MPRSGGIQAGTITTGRQQPDDFFMFEILSAALPLTSIALRQPGGKTTHKLIILARDSTRDDRNRFSPLSFQIDIPTH